MLASILMLGTAPAATRTWNDIDGLFWSNTSGWVGGVVPVNGDDVIMGTLGSGNPVANFTSTYTGVGLNSLKLNATAVGVFTLSQTLNGSAMIATTETIGDTITGNVYSQNAGSNTAASLTLGNQTGGSGVYNLSGGPAVTLTATTLLIGNAGFGTMNQSGGTVNISGVNGFMAVGQTNAISTSNYNLSGGTLAIANGSYWALSGRGNFTQTGGAVTFAGPNGFYIGNGILNGVTNTYTLTAGSLTGQGFESIGSSNNSGGALFTQSGGSNTFGAGGTLTAGDAGNGTYSLSGTGQLNVDTINIGNGGSGSTSVGTFNQNGGTATVNTNLNVSSGAGGSGNYNLSAGTLNAANETVAGNMTGIFSQTGGSNTITGAAGALIVGQAAGSVGTYNLSGAASTLTAPAETFGNNGSGTMTQAAGTNTTNSLTLGANAGASGSYNLNGGNLVINNSGALAIGLGATGAIFTQAGGITTLNGPGNAVYLGYNQGSSGTYLLKAGSLATDSLYVGVFGTAAMTQSGGTATITNNSFSSALYVGYGGQGSYTLNSSNGASALSATNEIIGIAAQGNFTQRGNSTNTVGGLLTIGGGPGGTGIYNISAGILAAQAVAVGISNGTGTLNQSGSGTVTVQAGGMVIASGGGTGTYNLSGGTLTTQSALGGFVVNTNGSFNQTGGTYNGYLSNNGAVAYSGGTFNGTLENDYTGTLALTANLVAGSGVINKGTITIPTGGGLGSGTSGTGNFDNQNAVALTGGSLGGTGTLTNNGSIAGYGTLGGTGAITNYGVITQGAGTLTISNPAANTNLGSMTLASGHQLQLTTGSLSNAALLEMNNAIVTGAGTLSNMAAGTLSGGGSIAAAFQNSGMIVPGAHALNVVSSWTNAGIVNLDSPLSSVVGGTINNTGSIQGIGSVGAALTNNGTVEPTGGGTLAVTGALTNPGGGTLAAATGNKLLVQNGLAANAGLISLSGGTFDNNNHALSNTGQISGFGTLRTGGLTNAASGKITLTGGQTTVNGDVINNGSLRVLYNPATFTGNFTNNGTVKITTTTVTYGTGTYTNNGIYNSDPATNSFASLVIGASGALQGGAGDVFVIGQDLVNSSERPLLWDTSAAKITIAGAGSHGLSWSAADLGANAAGYLNNFAVGAFELGNGGALTLSHGGAPGGALYVGALELAGGLGQLGSITGNGMHIYYDAALGANAYLGGQSYALTGGGTIQPVLGVVPEAGSACLLGAGLGLLVLRRRRACR